MKIKSLLLAVFALTGLYTNAQLLTQDFSANTTLSTYINASTPTNGQWNAISTSGAGTVISIDATGSNKLRFVRTGNAGAFSRTTDFSPTPTSLLYKFDLNVSASSGAQTNAAVFQVGAGFGTANAAESNANVHSRFGINFTGTSGTWQLREIGGSTNSASQTGSKTITWAINNSGASISYTAPDGTTESVADDTWDLWIGTTKIFNDIAATTGTQALTDIKFAYSAGSGTIDMDNFNITPIPVSTITVSPTSLSAFTTTQGTPSAEQSYNLSGSGLTPASGNLSIAALSGYEYSLTSGGTFTSTLTVPYTGSALSSTPIYVRLAGTSAGSFSGNIANSGGGATAQNVAVTGSVNALTPTIVVNPTSLSAFTATQGSPSAFQSYTLSASALSPASGNLSIGALSGYEYCLTSGGTYTSTLTIPYTGSALSATTIYVRLTGATAGSFSGSITNSGGGATTQNVAVSGTVNPPPAITVTPTSLSGFSTTQGTPSTPQSYSLSGSNLSPASGNISLAAVTGYQYCLTIGGTYTSTLTVPYTSGTLAGTTIYVRLSGASAGSFSGNIVNSGGGATSQNVALSGTVVPPPAIVVSPTSLSGFLTQQGTPSTAQSYSLSGSNLSPASGNLSVAALSGYEYATAVGGPYTSTLTIPYTGGTLASTTIYVRLTGSAGGTFNGNIANSGGGATAQNVAVTGSVVSPPFVVINKVLNGATATADEIELLVIQNNADLRGLIFKDYSSNGNNDGGGVYTFNNVAAWNNVPAGTLIEITGAATAPDVNPVGDFSMTVGRANTTYFTQNIGAFDIAQNDIVMLKSAGSSTSGSTGAIHTLAVGSAYNITNYTGAPGYKYNTNNASPATGQYAIANNSTSTLADFNGTDASITSTQTFLQPNNNTNAIYICNLRGPNTAPTAVATGINFTGITASGMTINWTNPISGGGANRIVVARLAATAAVAPSNGIDYNTSTNFASPNVTNGTTGAGNVVVYDGTGTSVTINGLAGGITYAFDIYEYNGTQFCATYYTTAATASQFTLGGNSTVTFVSTTQTVSEGVGTVSLVVGITNPSPTVATTVQVALTTGTAADFNNYTTQTVTFPANTTANQTLTLTVTDDAISECNESFTFTLQNAAGGQGTATIAAPTTAGVIINDNDIPAIVINEIHYNPADASGYTDANYEFVELYNNGATTVDLSGYQLPNIPYTFPAGATITAGQYLVVAANAATYTGNGYPVYGWSGGAQLANTGETVSLVTCAGLTVDQVTYDVSSPWVNGPNGNGPSLELISVTSDNSLAVSWQSSCPINGSPGHANVSVCNNLYTQGSGNAFTDPIWAFTPNGVGQTLATVGGFATGRNVYIQAGHVVQATSSFDVNNLYITYGGQLYRNSSVATSMVYVSVYGNTVLVDGTLGNTTPTFDAIGLEFEGTSTSIVGVSGVINAGRFRKNTNTNLITNVSCGVNANLLYPGTALYNSATGGSQFNFTLTPTKIINVTGTGARVAIDGTNGLGAGNIGGTFTINGILNIAGNLLVKNNNGSGFTTNFIIGTNGKITADTVEVDLNGFAGSSLTFQASTSALEVSTALNLVSGALSSNNNILLKSVPGKTAYINNFSSGYSGTISGTVTQQLYNSGSTGFHYLSMPINNPAITEIAEVNLSGTDGGQLIPTSSCGSTSLAGNSPYGNVMEWHEDGPFIYPGCKQGGWYVRSAGTLQNVRGYLAKISAGQTLSVTGTPNQTNQTFATTLDNTNPTGDGWQLMGNPFPSPIQWAGVTGFGDMNLFSTVGIYTGTYAAYAPVQNKIIGTMQGFFVRRLAPGGLPFTLNNNIRRTSAGIAYQSTTAWYDQLLEIDITGNGFADHSTLYFNSEATDGYEAFYDARKMDGRTDQPTIYTHLANGNEQLGVNGLGKLTETTIIPLVMKPGQNGQFTLNFSQMATFPSSAMVYLEDLQAGTLTDLRANPSYVFTSNVNDNPERFNIRFEPPLQTAITDQTCHENGSIDLVQTGSTVWSSYTVADNNDVTYAQGSNFNGSVTIANLPAQEYIVTLTHPSGYVAQEYVTVNGVTPVTVAIDATSTTVMPNEAVTFTANATNAATYNWDFNDGTTLTNAPATVSHSFTNAGQYTVSVTAIGDNCEATETKTVSVGTTGLNNNTAQDVKVYGYGYHLVLEFNNWAGEQATIQVYNMLGKQVGNYTGISTAKGRNEIFLQGVTPGYYLIVAANSHNVITKKLFLGTNE